VICIAPKSQKRIWAHVDPIIQSEYRRRSWQWHTRYFATGEGFKQGGQTSTYLPWSERSPPAKRFSVRYVVGRINEVTLRRTGLVLRWVTVRGYSVLGYLTTPRRPTQPSSSGLLGWDEGGAFSCVGWQVIL